MDSASSIPLVESMTDEKSINPTGKAVLLSESSLPIANNEMYGNSLCCPTGLSCLISSICPFGWLCCGCETVRVREEKLVLYWGKHVATLREPGWYCLNFSGVTIFSVNTAVTSVELPNVKVADLNGNPLLLSGIVNYRIVDSKKALLDTAKVDAFVRTQALAVMKRVASHFPYEARTALSGGPSDHTEDFSLKGENSRVRTMLMTHLQEKVTPAGVQIISFDLSDLSYAPEIAQAMLVRQQALAMLEARKLIVTGAVEIAHDVLRNLEKKGIQFDIGEQARLTNNLLVTMVSEKAVNAQISLNDNAKINHQQHK